MIINEQDKEKFQSYFFKMIRIYNFIFILWKFLQMSKLLRNVLKISGGANGLNAPPWLRPPSPR